MVIGLSSKEIKVKVGSEKDCVQTVTVEMPSAKVKAQIEKAFLKVQSQARIPGFRPGKTPLQLIKDKFSDAAYAEAQDALLREGVSEAITSKNIKALEAPIIESVKFHPEKAFQFDFKVTVAPTFKLGSYTKLKIADKSEKVTDEMLTKNLNMIADSNAKIVESKDTDVKKNHHVLINYEGFLDGKPIKGTKAENFLFDLSAPQGITGLSDGIIGMKVDDQKDVEVKFPDDSPIKELAGKMSVFKVKVNAIKEKLVPQLDDEFAKDLGLVNFDELKSKVKENLEKESEKKTRAELEKQIIDLLVEENKFSVPPSIVVQQAESIFNRQRYRMAQQGVPKAEQDKLVESLKPEVNKQAEKEVKLAYILNAVSEQEKIEVTEEDMNQRIAEILSTAQPQERASLEKNLKGQFKDQLRSEMKDTKIFDFLIKNAKIK